MTVLDIKEANIFVNIQLRYLYDFYGENIFRSDICNTDIDAKTGEYKNFGIPATILANYLRENGIIPEKNDLNSILFLLTSAETPMEMENLGAQFVQFEQLIKNVII